MRLPAVIVEQASGANIAAIRELWSEYWRTLGLPLDFQGYAEELRTLPGQYAPPEGRLLLVRIDGRPAATAALRRLSRDECEAKRLFVHPDYRRQGLARLLFQRLIEEARVCGYRDLYGDTLAAMTTALLLYREIGFEEVGPYSEDPTPGAIYLRLKL